MLPGAGPAALIYRTDESYNRHGHHTVWSARVLRVRRMEQEQKPIAERDHALDRTWMSDPVQRCVRRLSPRSEERPGNVRHADQYC